MVRGGEIESDPGLEFDVRIAMELGAIVERDGAEVGVEMLDGACHCMIGLLRIPSEDLVNHSGA